MRRVSFQTFFNAAFRNNFEIPFMTGNRWDVKIIFEFPDSYLDGNGITICINDIRRMTKEMLPNNVVLNDYYDFPPTFENLAEQIYYDLHSRVKYVAAVEVSNGDNFSVEYRYDSNKNI